MSRMLSEVIKHLDGHPALYDFADAVVQVRLKTTLDMYLEEIKRLDNMGKLSEPQMQDHEELLGDVVALTRVINFYGFEENTDD
jgi:hypothetical protein